jgi:hypothetical protein
LRIEEAFFDMLEYGLQKISDSLMVKRSAWLFKRIVTSAKDLVKTPPTAKPWTPFFDWSEAHHATLTKLWDFFFLASDTLSEFDKHIIQVRPIFVLFSRKFDVLHFWMNP